MLIHVRNELSTWGGGASKSQPQQLCGNWKPQNNMTQRKFCVTAGKPRNCTEARVCVRSLRILLREERGHHKSYKCVLYVPLTIGYPRSKVTFKACKRNQYFALIYVL